MKKSVIKRIFTLSSGKIDKYELWPGEEILPPQQHTQIQETTFSYSLFGKALEKQPKQLKNMR